MNADKFKCKKTSTPRTTLRPFFFSASLRLAVLIRLHLRSSAVTSALSLLDHERIDRRAYGAGNRQRRRHEHELVALVLRTLAPEFGEVEDFTDGKADAR